MFHVFRAALILFITSLFSTALACSCRPPFSGMAALLPQQDTLYQDAHIFIRALFPEGFTFDVTLRDVQTKTDITVDQTQHSQYSGYMLEVEPLEQLIPGEWYEVIVRFTGRERIIYQRSFKVSDELVSENVSAPFIYGYAHSQATFCEGENVYMALESLEDSGRVFYVISSPDNSFDPVYVLSWKSVESTFPEDVELLYLGQQQCSANFELPRHSINLEVRSLSWSGQLSSPVSLSVDLRNPELSWDECRSSDDREDCYRCLLDPFCSVREE